MSLAAEYLLLPLLDAVRLHDDDSSGLFCETALNAPPSPINPPLAPRSAHPVRNASREEHPKRQEPSRVPLLVRIVRTARQVYPFVASPGAQSCQR